MTIESSPDSMGARDAAVPSRSSRRKRRKKRARRRRVARLKRARNDQRAREYFPRAPAEHLYAPPAAWPELTDCLCILFAARSGSTFLSEQIECRYALGHIRESFNFPQLQKQCEKHDLESPGMAICQTIRQYRESGWFGVKAGPSGLLLAENCGFFGQYLEQTRFILLLRRDIVAQAVSATKAKITSRYHFQQPEMTPARSSDYSYERIAQGIRIISRAIRELADFAHKTERPCRTLVFEDFESGDFGSVESICDDFGMPRRETLRAPSRDLQKIGDALNEEWCARFREEMDDKTRRRVEKHLMLAETARPQQANSDVGPAFRLNEIRSCAMAARQPPSDSKFHCMGISDSGSGKCRS